MAREEEQSPNPEPLRKYPDNLVQSEAIEKLRKLGWREGNYAAMEGFVFKDIDTGEQTSLSIETAAYLLALDCKPYTNVSPQLDKDIIFLEKLIQLPDNRR